MNKKTNIWVTFRKEGIHKYPAALDDPKLATGDEYDVSFLGYPHRHIFHFKVGIEVFHDDRDIEFIQFKRWLEKLYAEKTLQLDYKSYEMMSDDPAEEIGKKYPEETLLLMLVRMAKMGVNLIQGVTLELYSGIIAFVCPVGYSPNMSMSGLIGDETLSDIRSAFMASRTDSDIKHGQQMTIYIVDLEAVDTRYTQEWKTHLSRQIKKQPNHEVVTISGGDTPKQLQSMCIFKLWWY